VRTEIDVDADDEARRARDVGRGEGEATGLDVAAAPADASGHASDEADDFDEDVDDERDGDDVALTDDGTVVDLAEADDELADDELADDADVDAADADAAEAAGGPDRDEDDPIDSFTADDADLDLEAEAADLDGATADSATEIEGEVAEGETIDGQAVEGEAIDAEALLEEEAEEPEISPYDRPGRWYVVHTQSGYENKVRQNLEARIGSMNMEGRIHEVVIPVEDVVEFKGGRKVVVPRKVFPGYLLVRCQLDDDSWYVIRNTPGVTGFVGQGNKPSPLPRKDVEAFLSVRKIGDQPAKRGKPRLEYELGETVRVKEGPFADFSGEIVDINEDQLKVKVLVNIFGRETPVELEFSQIARL